YNFYMIAKKGGKYGLINEKNKVLLPFEYESIQYLFFGKKKRYRQEYITVKKGGKYGLIDRDLKEIFPIQYDKIQVERGEIIQAYEADKVVEQFDLKTQQTK
ncbi:MAG: WG repeat-containing protein, partial [Saprospiraceae bacterium]